MLCFQDETECMTAVLHDVVEDTVVSLDTLRGAGYPADVVSAVDALTRRDYESYAQYIERVACNRVATHVKVVDLAENLANNERNPDEPDNRERISQYRAALARLTS